MMKEGHVTIIDIRKNDDYRNAHIKGAFSLEGNAFNDFIHKADKSKTIICYCYKGISSKRSCRKLIKAGFHNVYNLKGGYNAWCKE